MGIRNLHVKGILYEENIFNKRKIEKERNKERNNKERREGGRKKGLLRTEEKEQSYFC